jgi:hypothetical protein
VGILKKSTDSRATRFGSQKNTIENSHNSHTKQNFLKKNLENIFKLLGEGSKTKIINEFLKND